ncbi:gamma-glutamylcyclotransferase [Stutzerimonas kirkiae]|uniref:glutathione-specific gamma-glutamylcyclotransferase n=1 Tax=Stutzerimonas kirkiae TaxID=2211392 RepID=A0A4Q9R8U3_9GAMM|nr:gamma-glutamylcyclotransferase [Stutzerimonas kirkiae]TBU96536.1 gamma-glutamylcyclotransferase [Stutzerimonas kirkiae]TBV02181.1 gamma-glutamylcyclotransferase [Stutzerimonas kirkiae]TBV08850.1 gamma-glutamylcyclotransferase [Stutzerimonas kirkiae]TBV15686.1 gamma-glutamylcyclotransferase [Stutzerimonas kirkiae]
MNQAISPFDYPTPVPSPRLSAEQMRVSMEAMRRQCGDRPFWLFAYGSLIWRPECPSLEVRRARLHGYHRGLYLWSHSHRGTPEQPGLVFGLDRGGSCNGFAYRLAEDGLDCHLRALWQREMPDASYQPKWLNCRLDDGSRVNALAFVLRRQTPSFAGNLPDPVLRQVLANARGHFGTTRDYVEQTASALRRHAMPDRRLEATLARCCS